MKITRRGFVAGATASVAMPYLGLPAFGQQSELNIFAHRVMETVSTNAERNITLPFEQASGAKVKWSTFETGPLHDRVFREASLSSTAIDVAFILNTYATPRAMELFEPLNAFQQDDPIENIEDIFPGLRDAMTFDDKLYAVPFRHASTGLHYNEAIFAERGIDGPPKTVEEFIEIAKHCTFTRDDGTSVVGFGLGGLDYPEVVVLARGWNGDFITPDMQVVANSPAMVKAVTVLRDLYEQGAIPRNITALSSEDVNTWMQTGRCAMAISSMSRNRVYNDAERSQFAGSIKTVAFPISEELLDQYEISPTKVEFWSMAIPKNSTNKELAWQYIKSVSSLESAVLAALNGNGPVRNAAYDDPRVATLLPYSQEERRVLAVSRVPLPAFDDSARAADIFKEETEAAVLGSKDPQKAMDDVTTRVQALLSRS